MPVTVRVPTGNFVILGPADGQVARKLTLRKPWHLKPSARHRRASTVTATAAGLEQ
jgi:hypothetical protein